MSNDFSDTNGEIFVAVMKEGARLPTRAHEGDAGLDLYAPEDISLEAFVPTKIDTGIAIELRPGEVGLILPRSSMNKEGVHALTGVIDSGYRGTISVVLQYIANPMVSRFKIAAGARIAQLVITPVKTPKPVGVHAVDPSTERGKDGFGSTGR
jgi:dUTP pyrophosphatase